MTQESIITDEMRAAIGREMPPYTLEIDKTSIRLFARAVGHTDRIYYNEEYARSKGHRSLVCPPGFLGQPVYGPDQLPRLTGYVRLETPLKRVLNGGNEFEYFDEDICAGDVLTATTKLADLKERPGSMGPMLFITSETTYKNQQGKVVAKMLSTGIQY
jgi:hydroxyacyl-ACP dehydratase HTD2-like protein with hotdog domain